MAWDKVWVGTTGDYSLYTNWQKISVRNASYAWTASGSGTNEYYLRTAASGDPGIGGQPGGVYINSALATEGTAGSLTAGQWDYADNDTLGYSTIYVRLSGGGDPDAQSADHVQFQSIPVATDNVRIARGSGVISSGMSQSAVAINRFIVEEGYANTIGSATLGYLQIDPDIFVFEGTGAAFINLGSAAIDPEIRNTASAAAGYRGLYLLGTAMDVLNVLKGKVGVAVQAGEVSTVDNVRVIGGSADVWLGSGVTVSTGVDVQAGILTADCTVATSNLRGGTTEATLAAALTTVNLRGGTLLHNSTGTLGTLNWYSGTADWTQSGVERTVTTINAYEGGGTLRFNKQAVTYTNGVVVQDSQSLTKG
jgi:hypothetical protein